MSDRVRPAPSLARALLRTISGHEADTQTIDLVPLNVGELRSLCSIVVRLETYLDWAEKETEGRDAETESEWQAGHTEATRDVECFVLDGKLEEMLRDVGCPDLVRELQELRVGS